VFYNQVIQVLNNSSATAISLFQGCNILEFQTSAIQNLSN